MSNVRIANMQLCTSLNLRDTTCLNYCWLHSYIYCS